MGFLGIIGLSGLRYSSFERWVDSALTAELPEGIIGFCFNLYDDGEGKWSLEFVGTSSFDKENEDWACDEVFSNRDNCLQWKSRQSWESVLMNVRSMLSKYLKEGMHAPVLLSKKGVGLGFVDGDLIVIQ